MQKYREDIIKAISELVVIPSVYEASDDYLFGKPIDDCLTAMLSIAKTLGFKVFRAEDSAYGYAEIGEGEMLGVLGHLDVVAANEEDGWEHPPFMPMVKNGCLCGRGTQDDKGPIIAALYGLKALLDEGKTLKQKVRFIFGLDEETLWRSINIYLEREETPKMAFTPDSSFPLIYAEKGLLQVKAISKQPAIYSYQGGDSFNSVSAWASCDYSVAIEAALKSLGYDYSVEGNKIIATGVTAHAKNPWKGESANLRLLEAIHKSGFGDKPVEFVCNHLNKKDCFEGFSDIDLSDFSGPLSINLSIIKATEHGVEYCIDIRMPVGVKKETVLELLREKASRYDLEIEEYDFLRAIHVPLDSELVESLMSAYQSVTGDMDSKPAISGGATYARALDNCVAFGANFPGLPTTEHQPNEHVVIDNLLKAAEIYKAAFKKLVIE